jgi:hypothetical protein
MLGPTLLLLVQAEAIAVEPRALPQAMEDAMREAPGGRCASSGEEILVCSEPRKTYRVDPVVLAVERELQQGPAKKEVDVSKAHAGGDCIGPRKCGDAVLPLVMVALATLKAAKLAAEGEDWKQAFRSGPTEYQRYLDKQARAKKRPKVDVTLGAR